MTEPPKMLVVYVGIIVGLGIGLLWWNYSFPQFAELSDKYYKLWIFSSTLAIFAYLDRWFKFLPAQTQPIMTKNNLLQILIYSGVIVGGLILLQRSMTFSFIPLVAAVENAPQKVLEIGWWAALIIFGLIVPMIETDAFARTGQNSIREFLMQFGIKDVNTMTLQVRALAFGLFHFILGAVNIPLVVGAYLFSLVTGYLNWRMGGFMPELLIHVTFNSYIIGLIFNLPVYLWLMPTGFILFMLTKYSRYARMI